MWRVGDGTQINIWDDPWIPCSPSRKVATRRGNIIYTTVSELIDSESGTWDEEIIRELFWPINVQRILNIPLAPGMMNDFVSWHFTKSGTFSVRSALSGNISMGIRSGEREWFWYFVSFACMEYYLVRARPNQDKDKLLEGLTR
jgi:hypothetical protein